MICVKYSKVNGFGARVVLGLALGALAWPGAALRAASPGAPPAQASAASSAESKGASPTGVQKLYVSPEVPVSSFATPRNAAEGRDPFFPRSVRVYGTESIPNTNKTAPVVAEFFLKGVSGSPEAPLAIINNVTFGVGDELDVLTKAGRMKIRCLEINKQAGSAVVQFGGERRVLHLQTNTLPPPK